MLNQATFSILSLSALYVEIILEATISRVFPCPDVGVIFENIFDLEVTNWRMHTPQVL